MALASIDVEKPPVTGSDTAEKQLRNRRRFRFVTSDTTKNFEPSNGGTMKKSLVALVSLLFIGAGLAAANTYTIDPAHSDVSFEIRHLISKVPGQFNTFDGAIVADFDNLEKSSVTFSIDAASIDTANEDRDNHLRSEDFFNVAENPEITFRSTEIKKTGDNAYAVTGLFTMNGVTKAVTLPVTYLGEMTDAWGNTKAGFSIETTLNRKDYEIVWNKVLDAGGTVLGDDVEVSINLQTKKE
jgi:polyisoprenoid-binding protein YceI